MINNNLQSAKQQMKMIPDWNGHFRFVKSISSCKRNVIIYQNGNTKCRMRELATWLKCMIELSNLISFIITELTGYHFEFFLFIAADKANFTNSPKHSKHQIWIWVLINNFELFHSWNLEWSWLVLKGHFNWLRFPNSKKEKIENTLLLKSHLVCGLGLVLNEFNIIFSFSLAKIFSVFFPLRFFYQPLRQIKHKPIADCGFQET